MFRVPPSVGSSARSIGRSYPSHFEPHTLHRNHRLFANARKRNFGPIVIDFQAASLLPASDSRVVPCSGITARSCEVAGKTTLQFSTCAVVAVHG